MEEEEYTEYIPLSQNMLIFYEKLCIYTNIHLDSIADISGFPGGSVVKNPPANTRDASLIPGSGRFPGKGMATYSRILGWKIPWREEPDGL